MKKILKTCGHNLSQPMWKEGEMKPIFNLLIVALVLVGEGYLVNEAGGQKIHWREYAVETTRKPKDAIINEKSFIESMIIKNVGVEINETGADR